MEKYYSPSSEELRVGFECEIKLHTGEWKPIRLTEESMKTTYSSVDIIRVKYLDRDDIESFGFEFCGAGFDNYMNHFSDGFFNICFRDIDGDNKGISINHERNSGEYVKDFSGFIKNKSELEILLKQLGIRNNEEY